MIKKQVIDYLLSKSGNLDSGETWYHVGKRFGIESPNKERASKREKSLQGLENIRGYFPYKYGKNQLGAGSGNYSLNEATVMKELMSDDAKRTQEL